MTEAKKTRAPLPTKLKFELMKDLTERYASLGQTDSEFAASFNAHHNANVTPATVKHYREQLGIEQIKAATPAEMRKRIAELEAQLAQRVA